MLYAKHIKVQPEVMADIPTLTTIMRSMLPPVYDRGYISTKCTYQQGQHADDFVHNLTTIVLRYQRVKVPRILKRLYEAKIQRHS